MSMKLRTRHFSALAGKIQTNHAWIRPGSIDYLKDVIESRVYEVALETPLVHAPSLSKSLPNNCNVYLKREDLQPTFSFNLRGAYNKISGLTSTQRKKGIVACAAGSHIQGVAYSASQLGVNAVIVGPLGTLAKTDLPHDTKNNVKIVEHGADFEATLKEAFRIAQTEGRCFIHPFDDPEIIAGNGTVGMEIVKETAGRKIHAIFAPVGGGGLIAGVAAFVKEVDPSIKVIGVETEGATLLKQSLAVNQRVSLTSTKLNRFTDDVGIRELGVETFRLCQKYVDDVICVSTDEICGAIKNVFEDTRSLVEPTGAMAVAGAKKYARENGGSNENYVAILAAANMDFDRLRFITERSDERERFMAVEIPERKGNFQKLYQLIYPRNVTEFAYRMNEETDKFAQICMSIQTATDGEFNQVLDAINNVEDMTAIDLSSNETAKSHLRYLVGGRAENVPNERLYRWEFPERPGALKDFLETLGQPRKTSWNVSLFHYRNHGADIGRVLTAFQVPESDNAAFQEFLDQVGFVYIEETENPAYTQFLL